jgi:hypothetical protein
VTVPDWREGRDKETIEAIEARQNEAIGKVENFINRLHNLEITIDPSANQILSDPNSEAPDTQNFSTYLAGQIEAFRFTKGSPYAAFVAENCLRTINLAYTSGLVKEGTGLSTQLSLARKRISELEACERDLQKLSNEYIELQGQYRELDNRLKSMFKGSKLSE